MAFAWLKRKKKKTLPPVDPMEVERSKMAAIKAKVERARCAASDVNELLDELLDDLVEGS